MTDATCGICGREMAPGDEMIVTGMSLCDPCYSGNFGDALEQRGIRIQEMNYVYRIGGDGNKYRHMTEVVGAVAYDVGLDASFTTESGLSRLLKFLSMDDLRGLALTDCPVTDLTPLHGLTNLQKLVIPGCPLAPGQLEDLRSRLPNLEIKTEA